MFRDAECATIFHSTLTMFAGIEKIATTIAVDLREARADETDHSEMSTFSHSPNAATQRKVRYIIKYIFYNVVKIYFRRYYLVTYSFLITTDKLRFRRTADLDGNNDLLEIVSTPRRFLITVASNEIFK